MSPPAHPRSSHPSTVTPDHRQRVFDARRADLHFLPPHMGRFRFSGLSQWLLDIEYGAAICLVPLRVASQTSAGERGTVRSEVCTSRNSEHMNPPVPRRVLARAGSIFPLHALYAFATEPRLMGAIDSNHRA
ncbi:hypothetical protein CISG_09472 [Coccidioides immitis RMSCC 3703]|uniref:Uncharacterized protein n=2 Tax=Coccidioides immitis TaxID=5501 RepID=A0A0J8RAW4_COCIT|nr:hypothetical protein CIRG_08546 [Coccidioides immitis RMSCC 2394]KMU81986.1 hypothetical protein CISG_09472 [Coccidioides immitis RMSCC 3703]